MSDMHNINVDDLDDSLKYLMLFYELTKIGVVKFDLNNQVHLNTLAKLVLKVEQLKPAETSSTTVSEEYDKLVAENKYNLYKLIIINLYKNAYVKGE